MKKIEIGIKVLDVNRMINIKTLKTNKVRDVLTNIITNTELNLPGKNKKGNDISYALWYGNQNVSFDGLKLIDLGIETGDVFVLKSVLGKHKLIKKKPWYRRFSKKQAGLIALILFILTGSSLLYFYKEELFNNKLNSKQQVISSLQNEIEQSNNKIDDLNKIIGEEKEKNKIILAQKDSIFTILQQPLIYGIEAKYYNNYNSLIKKESLKRNYYLHRNIRYIEIGFHINQNQHASERYEDFFVSIEKDEILCNNEENKIILDTVIVTYTTKIQAYFSRETSKVICDKWNREEIELSKGIYKVQIYSKHGNLLGENEIEI